jgi:hypothetical protein
MHAVHIAPLARRGFASPGPRYPAIVDTEREMKHKLVERLSPAWPSQYNIIDAKMLK